jgi:NADH-quinone oxidoreductase subunit N
MVIAAGPVLIMIGLAVTRSHRLTFSITLAAILGALGSLGVLLPLVPTQVGLLFLFDGFVLFYSGLVLASGLVVAVLSYDYLKGREGAPEEFYLLLLGALLGALVLIASRHFVSFFLGLEILSISLYPLIAYLRDRPSPIEAAVKYLITAGASSAFLLFGMAIIYGLTGTMEFPEIGRRMGGLVQGQLLMPVGMVLLIIGIGFKLGVVPFHLWTPDVYEGAPAPVAAFVATVSKGAVFALLLRYFTEVSLRDRPALLAVFTIVAVASMCVGNLLALFQNNIKRLLAYSSIAHFGYLLVAFMSAGALRVFAVTYYLAAYFVATLGAFGVVTILSSREGDADEIGDYEGLFERRPWLAGVFTLMLLSLAGLPLTAGFLAKAFVVASGVGSTLWLPVLTLVGASGVALFYYLRVVAALFREPGAPAKRVAGVFGGPVFSLRGKIVMGVLFVLLIWWGVYPAGLMALISLIGIGR